MGSEQRQQRLKWIRKHDLVVLPGMHRTELGCGLGRRNLRLGGKVGAWDRKGGGPGMELEVVIERDRFFARLGYQVDADLDFEFAPAVGQVASPRRNERRGDLPSL